jgi:hypothetical protein
MGRLGVRNGQVVERRNITDIHGILQQLGDTAES